MQFFGGEEGETLLQVKAHLVPENTQGASTGAVILSGPVMQDVAHQLKILFHGEPILPRFGRCVIGVCLIIEHFATSGGRSSGALRTGSSYYSVL